jgi:hypothetical protein
MIALKDGSRRPSRIPTSVILQELLSEGPMDHVTLTWLMGRLPDHSFGLIMLLLAVVALVPGICVPAGLMLMFPAFEMIVGCSALTFPRRIAIYPVPTRHVGAVVQSAIPVLRLLEKVIHPRWPMPLDLTKRVVGIVVMMLSATLILVPIPLSNLIPALVIALISLAYLEEDGLMLSIGLLAGLVVIALGLGTFRETIFGAQWISRFRQSAH